MIDWITNIFQHRKLRKEVEKQAAAVARRKRDVHCISAHLNCEDCRYFHQSVIGDLCLRHESKEVSQVRIFFCNGMDWQENIKD